MGIKCVNIFNVLSLQRNGNEVFKGMFESVQGSCNKHFGLSVRESKYHSARDATSYTSHAVSGASRGPSLPQRLPIKFCLIALIHYLESVCLDLMCRVTNQVL